MEKFIAVKLFPGDSKVIEKNFVECDLSFSIVNDGSLVIIPLKEVFSKSWTLENNELICPESAYYDIQYHTESDCPVESFISSNDEKVSNGALNKRCFLFLEKDQKISFLQKFEGKVHYFNLTIVKLF